MPIMTGDYSRFREAIFERATSKQVSWKSLSAKYGITVSKLRTAYASWSATAPESQLKSASEIRFEQRSPGRPCPFNKSQELVIAEAVRYYADNSTPLTKQGVLDLVQQYIEMLPLSEQKKIGFHENRPSIKFCNNFLARHNLESRSVRQVEDSRVDAMTAGAHVTSDAVISALKKRELQRLKQFRKAQTLFDEAAAERLAYKEPAADIRRLVELAEERAHRRKRLIQSREYRRLRQKTIVARTKALQVPADATSPIDFGVIRRAKPCEIR